MKKILLFIAAIFCFFLVNAQVYNISADTLLVGKKNGSAELVLVNSTKDTIGVLYNYSNGKTRFEKIRKIGANGLKIGNDTFYIQIPWGQVQGNITAQTDLMNLLAGKEDAFSVLSVSKGGTGLSSIGAGNTYLRVNAAGTALEYGALPASLSLDSVLMATNYRVDTAKQNIRNEISSIGLPENLIQGDYGIAVLYSGDTAIIGIDTTRADWGTETKIQSSGTITVSGTGSKSDPYQLHAIFPPDNNNYVTAFDFNPATGIASISRSGMGILNKSFDGRYALIQSLTDSLQEVYTLLNNEYVLKTVFLDSLNNIWQNLPPKTYLVEGSNIEIDSTTIPGAYIINGTPAGGDNNYTSSINFDKTTGIFTLSREGLSDLTTSLDGRYVTEAAFNDAIDDINDSLSVLRGEVVVDMGMNGTTLELKTTANRTISYDLSNVFISRQELVDSTNNIKATLAEKIDNITFDSNTGNITIHSEALGSYPVNLNGRWVLHGIYDAFVNRILDSIDNVRDDIIVAFSFNPSTGAISAETTDGNILTVNIDGRFALLEDITNTINLLRGDISDSLENYGAFIKAGDGISIDYLNDTIVITNTGGGGGGGSNNYTTSLVFDAGTGELVMGRNGLPNLTENLDGRYALLSQITSTINQLRSDISDSLENYGAYLKAGVGINIVYDSDTIIISNTGSGGGEGLYNVNSVDELRSLNPETVGTLVFVRGYYSGRERGGGLFYWDAASTAADDSGYVFKVNSIATGRWKRMYRGENVISEHFGVVGDSVLLDAKYIHAWMKAANSRKAIAELVAGVYVFPPDFQYDGVYEDIHLKGTGRAKITTRWGNNTHEIVRRVDLKEPVPCLDCYVRVDRVSLERKYSGGVLVNNGRHDTTWRDVAYTAQIDDYIYIDASGNTSITTFSAVKAAGLLTELNLVHNTDNDIDGIYVVSATQGGASGGGYGHLELNQAIYNTNGKKVPVLIGTVLKRESGIWSRQDYTHGFVTGGSLIIDNIIFDDVSFYPFTTKGKDPRQANVPDRNFIVRNSTFRNVSRVMGLDRWGYNLSGGGGWQDWGGIVTGRYEHYLSRGLFNYDKTIIENNDFSYVHCSLFWEFAPTKQLIVRNNYVHDCYTVNEVFMYNPYGSGATDDGYTNEPTNVLFENNHILRVLKYSPTTTGYHIFRSFGGNTSYINNRLEDFTGVAFYAGGANNTLIGNTLKYHTESYPLEAGSAWAQHELFHLKGIIERATGHDELIGNVIVKSGWFQAIDMKGRSASLIITGGRYMDAGYCASAHSGLDSLREEFFYIVVDLDRFRKLATVIGNDSTLRYDQSIAVNDVVYWDERREIWMKFHKGHYRNIGLIDRSTTSNPPLFNEEIIITGVEMYGYHLMKIMTNAYDRITISNSVITLGSDLLFTTSTNNYVNHLRINNSVIARGWQPPQASRAYPEIKNLYFNNSTLYTNVLNTPVIAFQDRLEWINSRAVLVPEFDDSVAIHTLSVWPASTADYSVTFKGTGTYPQAVITGGYFNMKGSRYSPLRFEGVKEIRIKDAEFNLHQWKTNGYSGTRRNAIALTASDTIDVLELDNIYINAPNVATRSLITKFINGNDAKINTLKIGRLSSSGGGFGVNNILLNHQGQAKVGKTVFTDLNSVFHSATILENSDTLTYNNRDVIKVTGSGSYTIPAGIFVDKIFVNAQTTISDFKIGSTAGASDYGQSSIGTDGVVYEVAIGSLNSQKTIYFSGATSEVTITIFKR